MYRQNFNPEKRQGLIGNKIEIPKTNIHPKKISVITRTSYLKDCFKMPKYLAPTNLFCAGRYYYANIINLH